MTKPRTEPAARAQPSEKKKGETAVLVAFFAWLAALCILDWLDDATELTPSHSGVETAWFVLAALGAVVCVGLGIQASRGWSSARRVLFPPFLGAAGFFAIVVLAVPATEVVEGMMDFPRGKTTSFAAVLLISRAYATHGKGRGWHIQTMPLWSDIEITESDYDFMLAHLPPADVNGNPDNIPSAGLFCARVTMQRSGDALRVMHAGTHTLPRASVIVCPSSDTTGRLGR